MASISKEDFMKPMYRHDDSSDDDLDKFATHIKKDSQDALLSQDIQHSGNASATQCSSSEIDLPASSADSLLDLKTYVTTVEQANKEWKLQKKNLLRLKSKKLEHLVLFYWPAVGGGIPGKSRLPALGVVLANGAILARNWNEGRNITHIIVDNPAREYKHVLQDLKLQIIPPGIQLVKSSWVDAKLRPRNGILPKSSEDLYRILGHPKPSDVSKVQVDSGRGMKRTASDAQLDLQTDARKFLRPEVPTLRKYATTGDATEPALHKQNLPMDPAVRVTFNARKSGLNLGVTDENLIRRVDEVERAEKRRAGMWHALADNSLNSDRTTTADDPDALDQLEAELKEDDSILDEDPDETPESRDDTQTKRANRFLCSKSNMKDTDRPSPNADLIRLLEQLADHYEARKDDMFRAKGYRTAVSVIRKQKKKIVTLEEAKKLSRVGTSIAAKIAEFVQTGRMGKLEEFKHDPREQAIKLFSKIYGVGTVTAASWANKGYRTLEDISKLDLSRNQTIGLEHFTDFDSRIPRSEVDAHVQFVEAAAAQISNHLEVVVGGSYRRGQPDCGDIDFLITAPDSEISTTQLQMLVYDQLIPQLRAVNYIKADLTLPAEEKENSKWLGAACLPNANPQIWRRIDILVVPNDQWGAALIYFTGNDIFNRSLRLLARRSGGSLNQKGLYKNVVRDARGVRVQHGQLVEGRDEKKIFDALGVKWRPPNERCP